VFGQRSQLWWDVPVRDSFELLKDIYDIPLKNYSDRLDSLVSAMDVSLLLNTPVRQLSLGQRMRCEVIAALLHSPRVVFLDEPTIGLDAVSKLALREFLKNENREHGVTMILTTHYMDDIEALCERVMVIGHGKLLFNGVLKDLKRRYAPLKRIEATTGFDISAMEIEGAVKTEIDGRILRCWFDPEKTPAHKIVAELAGPLQLNDITINEQDIDEMIAAMYREMKL
jgi:ABC-2 type transport system ATP-binding protein